MEPERLWKLSGDSLIVAVENQPDVVIPLSGISKVRLAYEPTRMQLRRYRCYLYNASGKFATIQNEHYKGFASFEDRGGSYISFLHALLPRISSLSPRCRFVSGVTMFSWLANAAFLGAIGIILLLTMIFLYTSIGWLVVTKLLVIAFFVPTAIRWFLKNKPKEFSSGTIPEDLLPMKPE